MLYYYSLSHHILKCHCRADARPYFVLRLWKDIRGRRFILEGLSIANKLWICGASSGSICSYSWVEARCFLSSTCLCALLLWAGKNICSNLSKWSRNANPAFQQHKWVTCIEGSFAPVIFRRNRGSCVCSSIQIFYSRLTKGSALLRRHQGSLHARCISSWPPNSRFPVPTTVSFESHINLYNPIADKAEASMAFITV